jgi:hypothetical protein
MFDRTVNPYAPRELAALAAARDVRWVIVKKRLQVNGDPMPELPAVLVLLQPHFHVVAQLRNYTIYARASGPAKSSSERAPSPARRTSDSSVPDIPLRTGRWKLFERDGESRQKHIRKLQNVGDIHVDNLSFWNPVTVV